MATAAPDGVMPWRTDGLPPLPRKWAWQTIVTVAVLASALVVTAAVLWRPFPVPTPAEVASARVEVPTTPPSSAAPGEPRTVVSLTFNDGSPSQYRLAAPLLRHYGLNGTFYLPTGRIDRGEACCISWKQARDLYRMGDEIGGTGADDRDLTVPFSADPAKDYAAKKRQICAGRQRLNSLGFDPRSFAYPAGAYRYDFTEPRRSLTQLVRECGYASGRIVGGLSDSGDEQANAMPPELPYVVRTPDEGSRTPITLEELQHPVVRAAESAGQWVPLIFNEICARGDPDEAQCLSSWRPIDASVLSEFLGWLSRAGQPGGAPAGTGVRTVRQAMGAPPQPPLRQARTIVSLTFDDGDATQQLAGDILRAHGMHGTFFVNSGFIDRQNPYYLSWSQVLALQRDGNEIGGHTVDHVNLTDRKLSPQARRDQVCKDRVRLLEMGVDARSFAYPEGALNRVVETLPRACGYSSARTAGGVSPTGPLFAEHVPPSDPFATAALDGPESADAPSAADRPGQPLRAEDLRRAVVAAATQVGTVEQDGWVQIVLHRVCASADPLFAECMSGQDPIDDHTLGSFLDWLQHGAPPGTVVMTVRQVMVNQRR